MFGCYSCVKKITNIIITKWSLRLNFSISLTLRHCKQQIILQLQLAHSAKNISTLVYVVTLLTYTTPQIIGLWIWMTKKWHRPELLAATWIPGKEQKNRKNRKSDLVFIVGVELKSAQRVLLFSFYYLLKCGKCI